METIERIAAQSLNEALRVHQKAAGGLLARPGVFGVDVGFKYVAGERTETIAIRVHLAEKRDVEEDERIPAAIDGVPTDVLAGRMGPGPADWVAAPGGDTSRYDPLVGGISAARCEDGGLVDTLLAGTLGCMVVDLGDRDTAERGMPMLLGSAQSMGSPNGPGVTITQPSPADYCDWLSCSCNAQKVGRLSRGFLGSDNPTGIGVDAAVAHQTDRGFTWEIAELGAIAGTASAALGTTVRKRGRTTRISYGVITGINATYVVTYPNGETVTLTQQFTISSDTSKSEHFMEAGDAGAVVVDDRMEILGVLWGFNNDTTPALAGACPIGAVQATLGVQVPYSAPGIWIRNPHPPTGVTPSTMAPSLAVMSDNQLGLAWTDTTGRINIATSADGVHFDNSRRYEDMRSHNGPWLARGVNGTYVAFTDDDGQVCLTWFRDWVNGDDRVVQPLGEHSPHGPAVVGVGEAGPGIDSLVLTWTASDGVIWARFGTHFGSLTTNRRPLPVKSPNGPCMTSLAGPTSYTVGVGFRGEDSGIYFRYTSQPASLDFPTEVHIRNERTVSRPAAVPLPNAVYPAPAWLVWRGTDSHNYLNLQQFDPAPRRKVVYPYETNAPASLAMWKGGLWIAWLSNENSSIYVAPVR